MCNACGFYCCGYDSLDGCGCDCDEWRCRSTRCGGCGQTVDLFEDECACWGSDDWTDDDEMVVTALGNGSRERLADPSVNGSEGER
ncbi:MAG TPA: hypothetical protein VFK52_00165 [Nocardioidaceae bacterium]|nr:hypothetical protein [Nocardioidaceae bacterium]